MTIQFYLFTCCLGGSVTGAFFRWLYPTIFKSLQKKAEFTELNCIPTLVVGFLIGIAVAIFFNGDIAHFDSVHYAYIEKLGLISGVFTISIIDRIDQQLLSKINKILTTHNN